MGVNDEEMKAFRPVALRGGATENGGRQRKGANNPFAFLTVRAS